MKTQKPLDLSFEFDADEPAGKQISEALKRAILQGQLKPGSDLPSVRELGKQLNVSRSTIARAIESLVAMGYITSEPGSGCKIATFIPSLTSNKPSRSINHRQPKLSDFAIRFMHNNSEQEPLSSICYGAPALADVPLSIWANLLGRQSRQSISPAHNNNADPFGYLPLRDAYSSYLVRARAVKTTKDQLITFSSRNLRIDLIARLLIDNGDKVVVEEPGCTHIREQLYAAGASIVGIPVDEQGLQVERLFSMETPAKLIFVTPSHHVPTGAVMSMQRRKQLLKYAYESGAYIIEDDYDGQFRYDGRPLPSMQCLDEKERVIYLSCLWRILAPISRIGFMVVPPSLVGAFSAAKCLTEKDVSFLEQAAMADFINDGHLERIIRKLRTVYASRRKHFVNTIRSVFSRKIWIATESAGLDLLVRFDESFKEEAIENAATMSALPLTSTHTFYQGPPRKGEYVVAFASMDEETTTAVINRFFQLLNS